MSLLYELEERVHAQLAHVKRAIEALDSKSDTARLQGLQQLGSDIDTCKAAIKVSPRTRDQVAHKALRVCSSGGNPAVGVRVLPQRWL
jgi:hypothetical protein